MTKYVVQYSGWTVVEATDEQKASYDVGTLLANSGLPNNGDTGEWLIEEVENE